MTANASPNATYMVSSADDLQAAAKDASSSLEPGSSVLLILSPGVYLLSQTLVFDSLSVHLRGNSSATVSCGERSPGTAVLFTASAFRGVTSINITLEDVTFTSCDDTAVKMTMPSDVSAAMLNVTHCTFTGNSLSFGSPGSELRAGGLFAIGSNLR
jgi:hypothetical protein